MAALMRHGVLKTVRIKPKTQVSVGCFATKAEKKKGIDRKQPPRIDSSAQSLAAKGFLRPHKPYTPPPDVDARLDRLFRDLQGGTSGEARVGDLSQKFDLLSACAREFDHPVPNSLLHTMQTLNDVKNFYQTPVDTITPLDKMRDMELPENLHVQFEYHRFHPETDTMFKGQTAFNGSSTLVTGLKYKDKYKGHIQNQTWPFNS
ncbi:uncharacterized protein mRpL50 [Tenebrio molitor]|jgi:large subunit ribosomal protein L50|uniref:uncharacterized protein mRpL50 n=1 Tax=Tenebrio molitor TaxID=7067 RepID=UPI001C3A3102|nr:unnamed protein product [Tenebrio molitor]